MSLPDWQLPPGVSRSLWEFAADERLPYEEDLHLADSPLHAFDRVQVRRWCPSPGAVLDLGCGTGRMLPDFSGPGWGYTGVDLSQESLAVARGRLAGPATPRTLLIRGNLCALDFLPAARFDYALLLFGTLGMVQGAAHRKSLLVHAHRALKPAGRLLLHVHSVWPHLFVGGGRRWFLADMLRRLLGRPDSGDTARDYRGIPGMYHHVFTRRELRALLADAGFTVKEMIPLRPAPVRSEPAEQSLDLTSRGLFRHLRATGWLVLAESNSRGSGR